MKIQFKHIIRQIVALLLYYSGITFVILFLRTSQKVVVLTYHHVIPDNYGSIVPLPPGTYVTQKVFDMQMRFIKRFFKIITLKEFCEKNIKQKNPKRYCLITFDDGWKDNLYYAHDVLKKYNLPATIFISTRFVEEKAFNGIDKIFYFMVRILSSNNDSHQKLTDKLKKIFNELSDIPFKEKKIVADDEILFEITEALKKLNDLQLEKLCYRLEGLAEKYELDSDGLKPEVLNWDELRLLIRNGIEIGAHTHNHSILTHLPDDGVRTEAITPKKLIEQHLQTDVKAFAYPDGKWDVTVANQLQKAGYLCAFTNTFGYHREGLSFSIPRINIHQDVTCSKALFVCELSGIFYIIKNTMNKLTSRELWF
jgi:peptidoglycan/xylan/chitin deacetylase (PgdA/CDA1 family)